MAIEKQIEAQRNRIRKAVETGQTVLLTGPAGVGKTSILKQVTKDLGFDMVYYSAPTMDVFLEFTGIPEKVQTENGPELRFALPENYRRTRPWVLFVDEVNRADKRVTNTLFEIAQFGSVNGKKLPNLVTVVAAANPPSDVDASYHTNDFDVAFKDRFTLQEAIAARIDVGYFASQFGPSMAKGANEYWGSLNDKQRVLCSPRRLEKACLWFTISGSTEGVLDAKLNFSQLDERLKKGDLEYKITKMARDNDVEEAKTWINKNNNYHGAKKLISEDQKLSEFYFDVMVPELKALYVVDCPSIVNVIVSNPKKYDSFLEKMLEVEGSAAPAIVEATLKGLMMKKHELLKGERSEVVEALKTAKRVKGGKNDTQELIMKTLHRAITADEVLNMNLKDPDALISALNIYKSPEGPDITPDNVDEALLGDDIRAAAFRVIATLADKTPLTEDQITELIGYWEVVKPQLQ